tara:strand:+ start:70 stop:603 length:534 start_codon:yes stop_codon:yes gene_type:complete
MPDCQKEFLDIAQLLKEKKDLTQRYNKGLQELNDNLQSDCDKASDQIRSVCNKNNKKLESDYKAQIKELKQVKKVLKEEVIKLRKEKDTQKQKIMEAEVAIAANVSHQGTIKKHMNEIARLKRENEQLLNLPATPDRKVSGGRKRRKTRRKTRRKRKTNRRKRRKRRTKRKSNSRRN